jgi:CubicO group peptidase (beta-lactamase class C family)
MPADAPGETGAVTHPNPDLEVVHDNKANWNLPDNRRRGFHNLHVLARYATSYRATRVLTLIKRMDMRIPELPEVKRLTGLPWFSGMVVIRGQHVLFERYAPDFGPDRPHNIQSIGKMMMNLIVGPLVEAGALDPSRTVGSYLPDIGSGYATATVQQVLNMDVANDYTEDFTDPDCTYYRHEEAMGWRLPRDPAREATQRAFVRGVQSADTTNALPHIQYKDANTVVLGMLAEHASGRPLRAFLADIADGAGLEGCLHMTTDREGFPDIEGGGCVTARDLARFGSIFVRRGRGVEGRYVGSAAFIERTLKGGKPLAPPREWIRYSNHANTQGRWLGHGGYGGQYLLADLTSGVVGVFFSVVEDKDGYPQDYYPPVIKMLAEIAELRADG